MAEKHIKESGLQKLLAFDRQVRKDQEQSPLFLHRRDRRFALDCQARGITPSPDDWLEHLDRVGRLAWEDARKPARQNVDELTRWRRLMRVFMLLGLVLGALTMTGLLYYDGGQRINLTAILAFAALQCLLAVFTMVQSAFRWQPWRSLLRRLNLAGRSSALAPLTPLLMARVAHAGGIFFGVAGVLTLLVLVVIQDLAFGWSTTLNASSAGYHQLLSAIAWPWQQLWPDATPSLALVEATRFFRAETAATSNPQLWGQWWPFVTMVWLTYIVLPRLLGFVLSSLQLKQQAKRALAYHPGMVALEYRMETPTVDTGNEHHDAADQPDEQTEAQCQSLPDSQLLLLWAGAELSELPDSLTQGHRQTLKAGGQQSLSDDLESLKQGADVFKGEAKPAATLITRAWEPPTGELADFIDQAMQSWPDNARLAILPLGSDPLQPTPARQLNQWLRFSERLNNERVCISQPDLRSPEYRAYDDPARERIQ